MLYSNLDVSLYIGGFETAKCVFLISLHCLRLFIDKYMKKTFLSIFLLVLGL